MFYRLSLDVPYNLATEAGIASARNARDFGDNQLDDLNVVTVVATNGCA